MNYKNEIDYNIIQELPNVKSLSPNIISFSPNVLNTPDASPSTVQKLKLPEEVVPVLAAAVAEALQPKHVDLYLNQIQHGGNVDNIIDTINIDTNKFLRSIDDKTIFEFVDNTSGKFFAKGSFTAVFKIKDSDSNVKILRAMDPKELYDTITSQNRKTSMDESIKRYIRKYIEDKINFVNHIIEISYYGTIFLGNDPVCPYVITKVYKNHHDILVLSDALKTELVKQLLQFNFDVDQKGYVYRDVKFDNIGFEQFDDGSIKFIVLDYDEITLVNKDKYKEQSDHMYVFAGIFNKTLLYNGRYPYGTFPPPYLLNYYTIEEQNNIIHKLNKISSTGIVHILCKVFGINNDYLQYYLQFINTYFDYEGILSHDPSLNKITQLQQEIMLSQIPNVSDLQTKLKERIIGPLTNVNYDSVLTPKQLIDTFNEIIAPALAPLNKYLKLNSKWQNKYLKYKQKYLALKYSK